MSLCNFPACDCPAPHDMHLLGEPGSPYGMRLERGQRTVSLWMRDGTMLKRSQPDAVRQLRYDVRLYEARMAALTAEHGQ